MDLHTYLTNFCKDNNVSSYLEIGTREGDSLKRVVQDNPHIESLVCADMWGSGWGGSGRGNHNHISKLLETLKYSKSIKFLDGDSKVTIPELGQSYENYFDLILVDGDHSYEGGMRDLINVFPLCKKGGTILFHDITHHAHLYLERCFDTFVSENEDQVLSSDKIKFGAGIGIINKR